MFRKVALVLAAPLLVVTACAQEGDGEAAVEVKTGAAAVSALRAAPDAVAEAGAAQFEMVIAGLMRGESFEITATGGIDGEAEQMEMAMDMGAMLEQLAEAEGETLPAGLSEPWQVVADGSTMYMRAPVFEMMGIDGWISLTPEDLGTSSEGMGLGAGAYDFTKTLDSLRGVTGEPDVVGEEEVRGVATTHYRATMDLAEALEQAPDDQREQVEAALEQLGDGEGLSDVEVPVDIWIDADDLPRRMRMDMGSFLGAAGMSGGEMTMTMELFAYGEAVDIEVPSADDVTSLSEAYDDPSASFG